jgi:hypothetical protein
VPANISDVSGLVATGRLPIDIVLLQVSGPDGDRRIAVGPWQFRVDLRNDQTRPACLRLGAVLPARRRSRFGGPIIRPASIRQLQSLLV